MLTEHKDDSVTLGKDRSHVCLEAAWELDALGALLGKLEGEGLMALQVRAIAVRIVDLAGVMMMAVSDTEAQTQDLMKTVCPWKSWQGTQQANIYSVAPSLFGGEV